MVPDTSNLVNAYVNDPDAKGLVLAQVPAPTGALNFAIPNWRGPGLFNPGTPEFEARELAVVLDRTFAVWCDFFGKTPVWQPGMAQLPVAPRAGNDLNAYYDRLGLKFFSKADAVTGQMVYTCESSDIVAHECGHAILDAEHPDYWDSLLAETGAFHEAFGDMSAILVTLTDGAVRAAMLAENGGDLTRSNAVSRLAEQLACAMYDNGHPDLVVSRDALRDAVNSFRYRDPDKLPGRAPATKISSESHSFSRIFSGAFYEVLVGIYTQMRRADATLAPDAALVQARSVAGHLLAQGLTLAPQGDAAFKTIAACMFTADAQNFQGRYFASLRRVFVGRRVLKAIEADALRDNAVIKNTETSALGGTAAQPLEGTRPMGIAAVEPPPEIPSHVRKTLRLPKQDYVLASESVTPRTGRVVHYAARLDLQLRGKELGVARGAIVTMMDAVALHVDAEGRVLSSHHHKVDRGQERRIQDHVAKLVERGRVYAGNQREKIDPELLIERKQPYYISYDEKGEKRICRAFIACS